MSSLRSGQAFSGKSSALTTVQLFSEYSGTGVRLPGQYFLSRGAMHCAVYAVTDASIALVM